MKRFTLLLLPAWLAAMPLQTLIEHAKNNHTSLKSIEQRVSAIDNEYERSRNFADPVLSLTMSDIQLDDITNRSIERMQYTALNVQQRIPYFGKRDARANKIKAKQEKVALSIDAMKVKIVKEIKITAYSIWEREEELKITGEYVKLTKQNIELYSAVSISDAKAHMSIMSAEMSLSELRIKQSRLKSLLKGLYKKISYLSEMEVDSVEVTMTLHKPQSLDAYIDANKRNISYKIKEATLKEANLDIKVKDLEAYVDPVVKVGYFKREAFNDYINIGVAFSIPLYGTQESKTEQSRKLALASQSEILDLDNLIRSQMQAIHANLEDAYTVHTIIMHESMPQIEHMFELSSSSIKSGEELFIYIDLLEKKLSLDEKNIVAVARYHKSQARLDALIGEMK
ncbi:MAG: TolC family protein [Sulfurimonas sp.]|nr:TolC family protein [Sulfurimonas sp.]